MPTMQALVLGLIQGLTEFLPISSSGHLVFIPKLFGWVDQGLGFDVILHLGSLVAVVVYFRKKLWQMFKAFFSNKEELKTDRKLAWLIILSIVPAGIIGLLFNNQIETNLRSTEVIAFSLIFWGLILWLADYLGKKMEGLEKLTWQKSLFIGCAQAMALIPGTSRSGITMTAGLFSNLNKKAAAEFSFLMSVPIIFLAGLKKIIDLWQTGLGDLSWSVLVVGFLAAAVSGFMAIAGLMKIIQKYSFKPFVIYRIVVGILIILILSRISG